MRSEKVRFYSEGDDIVVESYDGRVWREPLWSKPYAA